MIKFQSAIKRLFTFTTEIENLLLSSMIQKKSKKVLRTLQLDTEETEFPDDGKLEQLSFGIGDN